MFLYIGRKTRSCGVVTLRLRAYDPMCALCKYNIQVPRSVSPAINTNTETLSRYCLVKDKMRQPMLASILSLYDKSRSTGDVNPGWMPPLCIFKSLDEIITHNQLAYS